MTILSDNQIIGLCSHNGSMLCLLSVMSSEELYKMPIPSDELGTIEVTAQVFDFIKRSQEHYDAVYYATYQRINDASLLSMGRPMTDEEKEQYKPMIEPFFSHSVKTNEKDEKIISYGLSSFGYDFRIAREFKIFTNTYSAIVDPKNFDPKAFVDFKGDVCVIPPNSFVLARTVEKFNMPRDVIGICIGKSTLARVGINCLCTPIEPGWSGYLTLEFSNTTPLPVKLYANEGGLQVTFMRGAAPRVSYADRKGKYDGQGEEITLPKV